MANVIKTVLTYQLDGSNRDFNIPFEYLARKFVVVTLIGVDRKVLTINTDYRFATRTTISLTKAWGPSDGYITIELRRVTSTTDRLVDFTDGSILRAYDLNVAQIQTMHVAEEARDLTADTIGVNNDGHLDARGRRIVNLANAVDDRDAVPFGQLKTMNQNSWQARNEALQFRNEAETFRNQAEGFKNESGTNAANTKQWRDEANGFRDEAEQFKNTAGQYATSAGNSATAAHQSEVNAENSATASANSAELAEQQADRAKSEADKLANNNAFAGTLYSITPDSPAVIGSGTVTFKSSYAVNAPILRATKGGMSLGSDRVDGDGTSTFINFYKNAVNAVGSIQVGDDGTFTINSNGWTKLAGSVTQVNQLRSGYSEVTVNNNNVAVHARATNLSGGEGQTNAVYNRYTIVGRGSSVSGAEGALMDFGIREVVGNRYEAYMWVAGFGGSAVWTFGNNGTFNSPADIVANGSLVANHSLRIGTCTHAADGNIFGSIWGNDWLTNYLNRSFKRKTKGWTSVWNGRIGAGGVAWLTQDVRFRTIWIRTAAQPNTWTPIQLGPDGTYMARPDPGWIRFTLANNGTSITNNQDDNSVPIEIVVENE
ncbi:phage tail fiber protein [Staphylococcus hyicus]|uniref:phage tail fiber domain-containing protein n=1 Tax=Staphylococcus hyicus TaxID=1284 RepID=UPI00208F783A|nr:phage tail fiber protein [Staphylococcus hyicus]MCO4329754.1 phage tail fiber protein [Staphylococcus hyicus]MCO4332101.1 phage tail fiber protein [Staphylococcus hyicus]MCO4337444.1 phage tail fiber protein [Staphylococcus hyicus]